MSIYIITHKSFEFPKVDNYIPLQVGAALHNNLNYLRDDSGDNISKKNPNYCELTGLYYIWKNRLKDDIVGMVHYRRYFFTGSRYNRISKIISYKKIKKDLEKYDIILPKKNDLGEHTVKECYAKFHVLEDLIKCGEIIKNKYPDYFDSFQNFLNETDMYAYNMFVMKRELFSEYMVWIFSILFEFENGNNLEKYKDNYNKRVYGFLSERLFNVWLLHKNLHQKEYLVLNTEEKHRFRKINMK